MKSWIKYIVAATVTSSMALHVQAVELPEVDPTEVTGDIVTAGSSTVFPLAKQMADRFREEGYEGNITIDSIGSGAGLERFCKTGETDVANASRPIKDREVENCRKIGREPIEIRVGTDALAVVVSKKNTFLKELTKDQLRAVFSTANNWSDIDPSYPNEPIQRFSPGTDSGTFDYFTEALWKKWEKSGKIEDRKKPLLESTNLQLSENDNVLVQGVASSPYAIGYFGYAYYEENADKFVALKIDGVEPNQETVDQATYPLARPLFLYSTAKIMQEKPQVGAYVNFFVSYVNEEVLEVGYFPAPEAKLDEARQHILDALK